ncbi:MAG: protein kinase [Myxococcales bacterium]|nr:protein kinase [Myxococcales bacterium]
MPHTPRAEPRPPSDPFGGTAEPASGVGPTASERAGSTAPISPLPPPASLGASPAPPASFGASPPPPVSGPASAASPPRPPSVPDAPRPGSQPALPRPGGPPSQPRMPVSGGTSPHVATMLHAAPPAAPPPAASEPTMAAPPASDRFVAAPGVALPRVCTTCEARYPADFLVCPRDATPLRDESGSGEDPLLGKLLGESYQITRLIGEGGMGLVYEARHLRLKERRFAVKVLHPDMVKSTEIVARFQREAESASSLSHPNVVDVFDVHRLADGTPYLVAEYLDGEELAVHVQKHGPLDARAAAQVIRQVCRALSAAHARGIVHRDMKPENVFVMKKDDDGEGLEVKVLDFGISKAGGTATHLTKTGVIMGTPSYMAPEQARGAVVDHRADVYSTGAVLYFTVTGARPFDSDDPTATLALVLTKDPVRPRDINPRVPEALELVIQRAMAKDPAERFASMADLERALDPFVGAAVVQRAPTGALVPVATVETSQVEAVARMLVGATATPSPAAAASFAKAARPSIVVLGVALGGWLVFGLTAALAGLVRLLHESDITLTESVLLVVGCIFGAATPAALFVAHVKNVVWPNSVKAVQLAGDMRRTAAAALVTYGGLSVVARVGHTVIARDSAGVASGAWDIAFFLLSLAVAAVIGGFGPIAKALRGRAPTA